MLKFHCNTCDESFNVAFENLYNKVAISCQNCGNRMPDKAVESLRRLSEDYMDTIDALYNSGTKESSWSISITESNKSIPRKPGDFDSQFNPNREKESYWQHRITNKNFIFEELDF